MEVSWILLVVASICCPCSITMSTWNKLDYKSGYWKDLVMSDNELTEPREEENREIQCVNDEDCHQNGEFYMCGCTPNKCGTCISSGRDIRTRNLAEPTDDTIATITAKIWYVSDFDGQVPQNVVDTWEEDTALNRVKATVDANLDYLNSALANSDLPIRLAVWGDIQDIGATDEEIGQKEKAVVFDSLLTHFGDTPEGRLRLYQTADVVFLYLNSPLPHHHFKIYGVCKREVHPPDENQWSYNAILMAGNYNEGWLFAHEAGHCLGGMHVRSKGYKGSRTNFAFCPPDGNYGTIDSYPWMCAPGPNGESRERAPYFSNPDVSYEGVPTGDSQNNNAARMREMRFEYRDAGSNCMDGKPDQKWMNKDPDGKIGNNCVNGEHSYEIPVNDTRVDCEYSHWSEWEECSKTCGGGNQTRTRQVIREAWYGGTKCSEEDKLDSIPCNQEPCQADGSWTEWTMWGECSKSCDSGVQLRTRDCSNPPPSGNGKNCVGEASEERDCNTKECSNVNFILSSNKYCYTGRYPEGGYDSFEEAKSACQTDVNCGMVYDRKCDNEGTFYLCPRDSLLYRSYSSCVYEKEENGNTGYTESAHSYCWDQSFIDETSGTNSYSTLNEAEAACNANTNCEKIYACQSGNCGYFLCSYNSEEAYSSISSVYKKKNK